MSQGNKQHLSISVASQNSNLGLAGQNIISGSGSNRTVTNQRRVTIQDLQQFIGKAESKIKKLSASLGDYDEENIEHHKVLKIIFSLCQKLLRLPGDEATKEFLQAFTQATNSKQIQSRNSYDSSGSSGGDLTVQNSNDYFPV